MLLIALATGWTVLYQQIDIDENLEIYIPVGAFIVMIHIMVAALTFLDVDANHKYHDFAGIQGWVLLITKLVLWVIFAYLHATNQNKVEKRSKSYF